MKKRMLSILMALAMVLTMLPAVALASDEDIRDTEFFTDWPHTELNYSDMEFVRMDVDAALAEMDEVRALMADEANVEAVAAGYDAIVELQLEFYDMYVLSYIRVTQKAADAGAAEDLAYAEEALMTVKDEMYALLGEILASPCAAAADHLELTEEDVEYLLGYETMTEEEMARQMEETSLVSQFRAASIVTYTTEYNGQVWDDDSVYAAYDAGEVSYEDYNAIRTIIAREKNAVLGEIYLDLVELRKEEAAAEGYDTYTEYAYELTYQRDYTPEEIRSFHAGVKEYVIPVYEAMETLFYSDPNRMAMLTQYTGEEILDLLEPCLGRMSDELLEAFTYMREHGFYDIDYSPEKADMGYTARMPGCNASFFFNQPYDNVQDLFTGAHEFGHYNNYYWQEPVWYTDSKSVDIAEVHSQGMELLLTNYYSEFFGESAQAMETLEMYILLGSIVEGAFYDELQQYVYATEDVTLQQINEEYCRLCKEYGKVAADDERTEMYSWVDNNHNFESPCYYISYAVSAAGAFAFWLEGQEDFYSAVDHYLEFVALDTDYSFQESFETVGMENPLTAEYLAELADALVTELDVVARMEALEGGTFADVDADSPYAEAVELLYEVGLMNGVGDSLFAPDAPMSRAMLATVLYRIMGEPEPETTEPLFADVPEGVWYSDAVRFAAEWGIVNGYDGLFHPNEAVTREQAVTILYRLAQILEMDVAVEPEYEPADMAAVSGYAAEAVRWAWAMGILEADENGAVSPRTEMTRGEAALLFLNFLMVDG